MLTLAAVVLIALVLFAKIDFDSNSKRHLEEVRNLQLTLKEATHVARTNLETQERILAIQEAIASDVSYIEREVGLLSLKLNDLEVKIKHERNF